MWHLKDDFLKTLEQIGHLYWAKDFFIFEPDDSVHIGSVWRTSWKRKSAWELVLKGQFWQLK